MNQKRLTCGLLVAVSLCSSFGADTEHELRQFVKDAVSAPDTFVMNPPAELRAYADLTPEALQKRQMDVLRNGSALILYPNGLPYMLQTRKNLKADGPAKTWFPDGTLQTDEVFENGNLVKGRYFGDDGKLLAEVVDGHGKQIAFDLTNGGRSSVIRRVTEYANGQKNGLELAYRDYAAGQVAMETVYRNGQKEGIEKTWMPSGQLNSQTSYINGKQDGSQTSWHANGNVQFLAHYDRGALVGNSSRYNENGQKTEETIRNGPDTLMEMKWYPEGAMMVCKKYDPVKHRVAEAVSFDRNGSENGRVENGTGKLIVAEHTSITGSDRFQLEVYGKDAPYSQKPLPMLRWNSATGDGNTMALKVAASDVPDFEELECVIRPPDPYAEPIVIKCRLDRPELTPTKIPLPTHSDNWSGTIYGETTVKGPAGTFHFTQAIYYKDPERTDGKASNARRSAKPDVPKRIYLSRYREGAKLEVDGVAFPPPERSLGGWTSKKGEWLLFGNPAALIRRDSSGSPWAFSRKFDFRPAGLEMLGNEHLIVWGTKATSTPERGIPYIIEESRDGGKTWKTFSIPEVDYVTRITVENGIIIISGIRLPREGLPAGKDWFELDRCHFLSNDEGRHFVEQVGISFLQIGTVTAKAIAPDGRKRAYVMDTSFQDSSYEIYLSPEPDAIPRSVLSVSTTPEIVWSADSQRITLRHKGSFFAIYDITNGKSEVGPNAPSRETLTTKQKEMQSETDRKIRAALEGTQ